VEDVDVGTANAAVGYFDANLARSWCFDRSIYDAELFVAAVLGGALHAWLSLKLCAYDAQGIYLLEIKPKEYLF
jgi:hypothetical protein